MPSRISSSVGFGLFFSRSRAAMIMPGVQKPHCRAWLSWKACCIGCSVPFGGEALDRGDLAAVGLDGEHGAALHALPVEVDGAGAAVAGVAADDGADLAELLAQVVDEQRSRLDLVGVRHPVDGDVDLGHRASMPEPVSTPDAIAM